MPDLLNIPMSNQHRVGGSPRPDKPPLPLCLDVSSGIQSLLTVDQVIKLLGLYDSKGFSNHQQPRLPLFSQMSGYAFRSLLDTRTQATSSSFSDIWGFSFLKILGDSSIIQFNEDRTQQQLVPLSDVAGSSAS